MIEVSFPPRPLWPNARPHWAEKAKAAKLARTQAFYATKSYLGQNPYPDGLIRLRYTLHPKPKGPHPDRDNIVAACKAIQDGICSALGVDDKALDAPQVLIADRRPSGALVVSFITD